MIASPQMHVGNAPLARPNLLTVHCHVSNICLPLRALLLAVAWIPDAQSSRTQALCKSGGGSAECRSSVHTLQGPRPPQPHRLPRTLLQSVSESSFSANEISLRAGGSR